MHPANIQYMVTSHQPFITEKHEAIVALKKLGYAFEPNISPIINNTFCGPDMSYVYAVNSMFSAHICMFGYIPDPNDTTDYRTHIHSLLTIKFMVPADVYVMTLCVNTSKNYKGAGKLLKDMVQVMRRIKMRRITLDSLSTENTLRFYEKHKFKQIDTSPGYLVPMTRDVTPSSITSDASNEKSPIVSSSTPDKSKKKATQSQSHLLDWLKIEMTPQDKTEWVSNLQITPEHTITMDVEPLQTRTPRATSSKAFRTHRRPVASASRKKRTSHISITKAPRSKTRKPAVQLSEVMV